MLMNVVSTSYIDLFIIILCVCFFMALVFKSVLFDVSVDPPHVVVISIWKKYCFPFPQFQSTCPLP